MGGVAGQEHAPVLVALRAVGDRVPGSDVLDHDRNPRDPDGGSEQLERALLVDRLGHVGPRGVRVGRHDVSSRGVTDEVDHQEAAVTGPIEPEEPPQHGVGDVVDTLVAALEQRSQINVRPKVDRDAVGQEPMSAHRDSQLFADPAAVPVGGDEVLRAHGSLLSAVEIAERGRDPGRILRNRRALDSIAQLGPKLLGAGTQDRLERVLVDEQPHGRAELLDAGVQVREVTRDLSPRE